MPALQPAGCKPRAEPLPTCSESRNSRVPWVAHLEDERQQAQRQAHEQEHVGRLLLQVHLGPFVLVRLGWPPRVP